ncbi:hypothetical protein OSB04_020844 [Centaurea solstitialis]|uniref:Uncharacterized protein n=1 Tax=Centaurea solstitialis TaxID=347529 RepID=A0AA38WH84_9ASTR|nr:hypothetical protein OSB04_020844 [Centaurea solstitialis]
MARPDDFRRTNSEIPNGQRLQNLLHFKSTKAQTTSLTFQQLLQLEDANWSQKQKRNHGQENDANHHNKKSVLAKVKEKAKKFKHSLSGKKHRDENDSRGPSTSPSSSNGQEEAKYRNTPSNVFSRAPGPYKQTSRDHPREAPGSRLEKHCTTSNAREPHTPTRLASGVRLDEHASSSNTNTNTSVVAGTDAKDHEPATTDVPKEHDSPESSSRYSSLTISSQESGASKVDNNVEEREGTEGESQTRDKGVSVKEYLMHKFEPGEDERALSLAITQTISPRRDKVREAMSSFLKNDEPSESTSKLSNSEANSSTIASDTSSDSKSKNVSFSPSHSSRTSNASSNLNQTFKSTVASYQNHNLGSSQNHNTSLNSLASSSGQNTNTGLNLSSTRVQSPAKISSSPLGHGSSANETRVSSRTETNTIRVPVSGNNYEAIEEENHGKILQAN